MKVRNIYMLCIAFCMMLFYNQQAIGQEVVKDVDITSEQATVQLANETPSSYFIEIGGPNNYYHKQQVDYTNEISLNNLNTKGETFTDGSYTLQITPVFELTPQQREDLSELRMDNDQEGIAAYRKAHGLPDVVDKFSMHFRIQGGKYVVPTQQEGTLNLPSMSSKWELDHPSLYASINTVGLEYPDQATDNSSMVVDQQILDDLIVVGSICVGQDCNNGESFGFDTLRLKENNLRIKFQDTSNSASFPTNDWQITANDSSNGGANKFSIDDIDGARTPFTIEAGAPSHSLYVDDGGRIGLGTSTPVVEIHVKDGDTPTLRLEQDGSSGFGAQIWDVAGNEANFFVRDATNGSTLPFRIFPGAPSNALNIEASTGDIGLGTTSPDAQLDVEGTGTVEIRVTSLTPTSAQLLLQSLNSWEVRSISDGDFVIRRDGMGGPVPLRIGSLANADLLQIGEVASDNVHVNGNITATGTITPDYVFEPDYKLESIEEHSAYMWKEKHLPAVEAAKTDGNGKGLVNLVNRSQEVLEELEKAHIYIDQLNTSLKAKDAQLNEVQKQLNEVQQRLANIEAKLGQ